jgi:regulator of protease activity HflC (stomatin/prohibitin superfamily)
MLESIIGWLREIFKDYIQWWFFVNQYQEAVILRMGKYHRTMKPGLYFKWPFIEEVIHALTIPTTYDLREQSLVTKDGISVTVQGMVKAKVTDTKKFSTEVYDQADALGDTTMGVIARVVMDGTYDDLKNPTVDVNNKITIKARAAAKQWGIEVMQVTLIQIAPAKNLRILSSSAVELNKI